MIAVLFKRSFTLLSTICILSLLISACGKKGDPTLISYEKPLAPSSLAAIHREGAVTLVWSYPRAKESYIAEFIVLKSDGKVFQKLSHIAKDKRTFVDRDINIGNAYHYKIISQNFRGVYSDDSNIAGATPVQPPPPPGNISYAVRDRFVTLSWNTVNANTRYNVYKADQKGEYGSVPLNPAPLAVPEFRDFFSVDKVVRYTVRGLTGSEIRDEGPASHELIVDPADLVPSRPLDLQSFPAPDGIYLSWLEATEFWVTGYRVYKKTGNNDYVLLGETQIPTFVDKGPSDIRRDYKVTAIGPAKEGPAAEVLNVGYIPQR